MHLCGSVLRALPGGMRSSAGPLRLSGHPCLEALPLLVLVGHEPRKQLVGGRSGGCRRELAEAVLQLPQSRVVLLLLLLLPLLLEAELHLRLRVH